MSNSSRFDIKYIYDLPYAERSELCHILDQNGNWEELGGRYMQFSMMEIQDLRREFFRHNSPTDELLTKWGHRNHTVAELFVLLSRMHHYQSMRILKPFVDPKYHRLLSEGEENISHMFDTFVASASKSNAPETGISNTKSPNRVEEENVAGAVQSNTNPFINNNMEFGQHNLNTNIAVANMHIVDKIALPPEAEQKILNIADNNEPGLEPESSLPPRKLSNASDASSMAESCGTIPHIPYKELVAATQGWDNLTILGKGGFGTVFKGNWKNTQVAIKRIEQRGVESAESYQGQMEQSLRELRILNSCRHDNILPVYGFSIGGGEPCLVYQFMPNGSLEDGLLCRKGTKPLTWLQRHNVAEGTARGLQFLHTNSKPFIHGDIKSANILLDVNLEPRIGDFGLAREGPNSQYTHMTISKVHGTRPYLPDEFLRSKKLSTKVDTFSYGIVLFELTTGLRAYDDTRPKKFLKEHIEACDEATLQTMIDKKAGLDDHLTFFYLIQIGKCCVSRLAKDRPEMEVVLKQLEGITTKRDMVNRAQDVMRQKSPSPSTPYEIQVLQDRLSQMRQLQSPGISLQPPSFANSASNKAAAEVNAQILPNIKQPNNPFLINIYTPPHDQEYSTGQAMNIPLLVAAGSSGTRNLTPSPTGVKATTPRTSPLPQHGPPSPIPVHQQNLPMISLNPASVSEGRSIIVSQDNFSLPATLNEDLPAHQDTQNCCDGLPLLSELGIKDNNEQEQNKIQLPNLQTTDDLSSESSSASSMLSSVSSNQPTPKGKSFLFTLD